MLDHRHGSQSEFPMLIHRESLLRRITHLWPRKPDHSPISFGVPSPASLADAIDPSVRGLNGPAGTVRLSRTEWLLLNVLLQNRDNVLSHDEIIERVWGQAYKGAHHLLHDTICRLRRRLRRAGLRHNAIDTVHGVGYRLVDGS